MRILYITDALAVWGGIERVLCDKANYLVAHYGYDVHIVTTDQGDHAIPYPFDERVHIKDLNIRSHHQYKYRGLKRLIKYFELNRLFLERLKEAIFEIKPDVIVCIRIESINTIVKAKGNIPLICESHSMFYAYRYEKASFWYRLRLRMSRRNMRKADCIVALTEGDANDWRQVNKNVCVIPNVVHLNETGRYSDLSSKVVLFVGRFSEQKDVWSLLDIWKLVHKRHPDWELHVYGEGEQKEAFIEAANKAEVGIKVFPPTSDIFEKYFNSSLLVMTSLYEPFGLVLPEAMSCGLPVVAFNCPYGPADIVKNGEDGFLVEKRNVQQFADHICCLVEKEELRCRMKLSAISSVNRFCENRIMPIWKELFSSISDIFDDSLFVSNHP
jgi:glycosyltransferase involved in cell wall biosynthesis